MHQPTFFLSSTIYDFADLRSAVKYYLEAQGAKVLASEYNDFSKPLNKHSYEACLDAINQADYYVLFIGSRVGGWYDIENKVSITRKEYRTAYELHKKGKLKILTFVRDEIWNIKKCRNDLSKYLSSTEIDPGLHKSIINHPTKSVSDADFIIEFIDEVGRNKETISALKGGGELPTANWIHTFVNFNQVIDVLNTQVFSGLPKDESLMRDLLLIELRGLLKNSLVKVRNKAISPAISILKMHENHKFILKSIKTSIIYEQWKTILFLGTSLLNKEFQTKILDHALLTNTFLEFSTSSGRYQSTAVHNALSKLQTEIKLFNKSNNRDTTSILYHYCPAQIRGNPENIDIDTLKILPFVHLLDRWVNIIELTRSIIIYLDTNEFTMPKLQHFSPAIDERDNLEKEILSCSELDDFLAVNA